MKATLTKSILFSVLCLFFISNTYAMKFISEQNVVISKNINDDVYILGGNVAINSNINGDVVVIGAFINLNANISGDLYCLGENIKLNGSVGDDLLCFGNKIYQNNKVVGDVLVSGNSAILNGNNTNVWVGANNIEIKGIINKNLIAGADKIFINGKIYGNATIESSEIEYGNKSFIGGLMNYSQIVKEKEEPKFIKFFFWSKFIRLIATIINTAFLGLILIKFKPEIIKKFQKEYLKNNFLNFFVGLSFLLFFPFLIVFLFLTVFGYKLGILAGAAYGLFIFLSCTLVSFWIGKEFESLLKLKNQNLFQQLLVGAFILSIIPWIPYIGNLIKIVFISIGAGVLINDFLKNKN